MSPINAVRGIVISDVDKEESKTILELDGPSRSPLYTLTPLPPRSPTHESWTEPGHDTVPPPYTPYPDISEHRIITINNVPPPQLSVNWGSHVVHEKALQSAERGKKRLNAIQRKSIGVCARPCFSLTRIFAMPNRWRGSSVAYGNKTRNWRSYLHDWLICIDDRYCLCFLNIAVPMKYGKHSSAQMWEWLTYLNICRMHTTFARRTYAR